MAMGRWNHMQLYFLLWDLFVVMQVNLALCWVEFISKMVAGRAVNKKCKALPVKKQSLPQSVGVRTRSGKGSQVLKNLSSKNGEVNGSQVLKNLSSKNGEVNGSTCKLSAKSMEPVAGLVNDISTLISSPVSSIVGLYDSDMECLNQFDWYHGDAPVFLPDMTVLKPRLKPRHEPR